MDYPNPSSNPKQFSSTSRASTWSIRAKEGHHCHLCYCCCCPFDPLCFALGKSSVAKLEIPMHPNHHQQYQLADLLAVAAASAAASEAASEAASLVLGV